MWTEDVFSEAQQTPRHRHLEPGVNAHFPGADLPLIVGRQYQAFRGGIRQAATIEVVTLQAIEPATTGRTTFSWIVVEYEDGQRSAIPDYLFRRDFRLA